GSEKAGGGEGVSVKMCRGEPAGYGHGGAQGSRQRATAKDVLFARGEIGCDTGKGDGEFVKALDSRIGEGDAIENQSDLVSGIEALRKANSAFQTELEAVGIVALVFFAAIVEVAKWSLAAKHFAPGNPIH